MATVGNVIRVPSFSSLSASTNSTRVSLMVSLLKNRSRISIKCSAVQESSASVVTDENKEAKKEIKKDDLPAKKKPVAAAKPLAEMMEEEVIPPLISVLEAQDDVFDVELSFQDNKLEGSFLKDGIRHSFWAFFPTGDLTGAKGFSISSYGSEASTVEPFLVDEKKPNAKLVVFWVEKRLAAQGIIPVWKE